ncbi:MAG: PIN domain-containing protein [Desulfococcaceae bacterium]
MIGLDTNVIVRFLVNDDVQQAEIVEKRLVEIESSGESVLISTLVLLEVFWVLRSAYGFSQEQIINAVQNFTGLDIVELEDENLFYELENSHSKYSADLADQIIILNYLELNCETCITFDKKASKVPGFELLGQNNLR